jgi:hypothetical protein
MYIDVKEKLKCPICNKEQEDLYLYYGHLRLYHSHEELARFLAFGEQFDDKTLVDDDDQSRPSGMK